MQAPPQLPGLRPAPRARASATTSSSDRRPGATAAAPAAIRRSGCPGAYPYLWLDARIERVREDAAGMVRHKALMVAYGVHESGRREVIGIAVGEVESEAAWREFLRSLVARGLTGVRHGT